MNSFSKLFKIKFFVTSLVLLSTCFSISYGANLQDQLFTGTEFIERISRPVIPESFDSPVFMNSKVPQDLIILEDGLSALEVRLQLIESAKKSINLETFIFDLDKSQRLILQALVKKANEGVKVRLLIDHTPIYFYLSEKYAEVLAESGIQVRYYNHTSIIKMHKIQHRNHKKVFTVDGKWGITGGRNFGDSYFSVSENFNYFDRDVLVQGSLVSGMDKSFDFFWNDEFTSVPKLKIKKKIKRLKRKVATKKLFKKIYQKKLKKLQKKLKTKLDSARKMINTTEDDVKLRRDIRNETVDILSQTNINKCSDTTFVSDFPGKIGRKLRKTYKEIFNRIDQTKNELLVDTPYFIVERKDHDHLTDIISRGGKVNVFVNSYAYVSDSFLTLNYFNLKAPSWVKKGVNFIVTNGKMLLEKFSLIDKELIKKTLWTNHAKSFVIDDKIGIIGSYNFDPRSKLYSAEAVIICENGPDFISELKENIKIKMNKGVPTDERGRPEGGHLLDQNAWQKFIYHLQTLPAIIFKKFI